VDIIVEDLTNPASIAGITAQTGIDAAALAEVLINAGLCTEATPGPAAGYDDVIITDRDEHALDKVGGIS
jgi:hypothetical protein